MNYYERHLGDYARDTAHLSLLEHGVYTLLLDRYYATELNIPANQVERISRARSKAEKAAVARVLEEFFVLVDGAWVNHRADQEIEKARVRIAAAQENGRRGGRPKKNPAGSTEKPDGLALGSENETQHKPSKKLTTHHIPDTTKEQEHESPNGDSSAPLTSGAPARADRIPYQAIVDAYNATMTGLPRVRELTPKRKAAIRSAWAASKDRRSIEFWVAYFAECQDEPFLNGTGPYRNGHENWRPDFDFLIRADTVTRTFERAMDRLDRQERAQ